MATLIKGLRSLAKSAISPFEKGVIRNLELQSRTSTQTQIEQLSLWFKYREMCKTNNLPDISETGFRCFSQFEEDGILLFIFAVLGIQQGTFLDLGAGDGINSNCANLALNFGWTGTFVDGDPENVDKGRSFYAETPEVWAYPPAFLQRMITAENVNEIASEATNSDSIDLLSVDIDGNDYWVWKALERTQPKVVIIETHIEFGMRNIIVPYDPDYRYPGKHPQYHGASPVAMERLAQSKGYRLVGANRFGFNTIYLKNGLAESQIPTRSVESILWHPRNAQRAKLFDEIADWDYVEG